jgi:hypothetical protein
MPSPAGLFGAVLTKLGGRVLRIDKGFGMTEAIEYGGAGGALAVPAEIPDGFWEVDNLTYHADRTAESSSTLEVFRRSIPEYYGTYVTGAIPRSPATPAQRLGTLFHLRLFQPEKWADTVFPTPKFDRRTKEGKQHHDELERHIEANPHLIPITPDEAARIEAMYDSATENMAVVALLESDGWSELGYRWTCPYTGIKLKCMWDRLVSADGTVVDAKTAAAPTPEDWVRAVVNHGYHRQAALYCEGRDIAFGRSESAAGGARHVHVVVGSEEPYETIVYELSPEDIELGRRQSVRVRKRLARELGVRLHRPPDPGEAARVRPPRSRF